MNLIKIADSLVAKYFGQPKFIKEEQLIGVKSGYYDNSNLDMAQYEENRSAYCYVYLDGEEIKGYGQWSITAAMKQNNVDADEHKTFGKITSGKLVSIAHEIDEWAAGILNKVRVLKDSKKDWEGTGVVDKRRRSMLKLLSEKYSQYQQKEAHPAMNVKNPPNSPPQNSPEVQKALAAKEIALKQLNDDLKTLEGIFGDIKRNAFDIWKTHDKASETLTSASHLLLQVKDKIEQVIAELEGK